ncbi:unnamed protein product [Vitrella brassicaformis CCMP3155]|uniref:Mitochondrial-processing peptidase subunit beta n=2 Tax=Vitrella brassicaformis TaxID=1169539 RepID=A0A0G4F2B3_VITBC|nr:unnamed protein product [Vitrella brassicaformis CCMP3155]|eukprot:CEM05771.1 unnamed protein product [Vitrella brassicaformis CCMP3155]
MLRPLRRLADVARRPAAAAGAQRASVRWMSDEVPAEAWLQPKTQVTTLPNGLRVATQQTFDETATIGLWIDSGSRYETKETNGAAHFLEHMAFKGTNKRNRLQLEKEIEDIGGHLNAYTSREQTVYYAKVHKQDTKQALDVLSDIILNSQITPGAIEEERAVILREMEEVEKSMEEVVFDRMHQSAFRDCSLGYTILGPVENIQNMRREHLLDYIKRNYKADRMVIAAAGPVDHKEIVRQAEQFFGKVATTPDDLVQPVEEKPYFVGAQLLYRNDEMGPTAYIAVAWEGVPWKSPDAPAFMVMQSIIGSYRKEDLSNIVPGQVSGNMTIQRIATKQMVGCADAFSAFNTHYKDTGLYGWYAECDEVAVTHCTQDMMFGNTCMAYNITEEEVNRAKLQLKTQMLGALDSTTSIAEEIGRQLLVYGRRMPVAEFIKRIDVIDSEEIKRVAWKYLHDREINIVGMGPLHGMESYPKVRNQTMLYRY